VGLNSLKSLNLTNVYPNNKNKNNKNKNNKKKKNNKVKSKPLELFELAGKKIDFLSGILKTIRIPDEIDFFFKTFQKNSKFKIYYAKWTLRIEVVNGQNNICYCIFRVYLVTGTKNPDISQEGIERSGFQKNKFLSPLGVL
jgi:hypothetical protein